MEESMFNFENKIVVVTGGAGGIGKCIREKFEEAGATVCVIDLLENDYFVGDLADRVTLEIFAKKVIHENGRVDFLINNAAPRSCGIENGSYEDFEYALRVGVTAPFYLAKLFAPYLAEGANIVNISSCSAYTSSTSRGEYCISKAGLSMVTKLFADRLAGERIPVNEICPGIIATGMTEAVKEKYDRLIEDGLVPLGRWGEPEDVAKAVVALCDGTFGYTTGTSLIVDGGMHIRTL